GNNMAFLAEVPERKERFSLLLLDPGEIYFEDFSVYFYPPNCQPSDCDSKKQRGRLKVCSHSIVFDPQDLKYPIIKLFLRDIKTIQEYTGPLFSKKPDVKHAISIDSSQATEMKEHHSVEPYVFKKEAHQYVFSLNYVKVDDCIHMMCQLQRAATLSRGEQKFMINAIVTSRHSRIKFNTSWLENLYEKIVLETQGDRITPLVTNPGRIMLTSSRLYFQTFNNVDPVPVIKIKLSDIKQIVKRRFLLQHVGIEIFGKDDVKNSHLYIKLPSREERDNLFTKILSQSETQLDDIAQDNMTLKWQNGLLSNYEYLMYLNSVADRSFNDLTQYPVFPWVVADQTSETLDLSNPATFRDLSKPIGALNAERLNQLKERYSQMPEPRFLYGSHYSTPGYVLFYLARIAPEYMLCLQNGKFDNPDRMFNSMKDVWNNCLTGASDFKELIPEFYNSNGSFLVNNEGINFGLRHDGRPVGHVELPPWCNGAQDFVEKLREALECEYVSSHLHEWIDLIFGYNQRGEQAELHDNVFYYLTYEGAVDLDSIEDINERAGLEAQIMEFGQTPKQLFTTPHPKKLTKSEIPILTPDTQADSTPGVNESAEVTADKQEKQSLQSLCTIEPYVRCNLHKGCIADVMLTPDGKSLISVAQDSLLKMYSVQDNKQLRSVNLSNMALSCCVLIPHTNTVVVGSWDNNIYFYSIDYGRILDTVYAHDDAISALKLSDNTLISASWDSTVKLWNLTGAKSGGQADPVDELDHEAGVTCIDINGGATLCVSGTKDGTIYIWDILACLPLQQIPAHTEEVHQVQFNQDNQQIISTSVDTYIKIIDINSGTEIFAKSFQDEIRCLCWDGNTLVGGSNAGDIIIWDILQNKLITQINAHKTTVTCLHLEGQNSEDDLDSNRKLETNSDSETCRGLVTGAKNGEIIFWRTSS
ncbi:unnamed protein product, partial [Owenia fusiformis]